MRYRNHFRFWLILLTPITTLALLNILFLLLKCGCFETDSFYLNKNYRFPTELTIRSGLWSNEFASATSVIKRLPPRQMVSDHGMRATSHIVITESQTFTDSRVFPDGLTIAGELTATGDLLVNGGLTVDKGGALTVAGALHVIDGLTVAGLLTAANKVFAAPQPVAGRGLSTQILHIPAEAKETITGSLTVKNGLMVAGELTVTEGLSVTGGLTVTGQLLILAKEKHDLFLPLVYNTVIVVDNGSFEHGSYLWQEFSDNRQPLILPAQALSILPQQGHWAARFGVFDDEISMISQGITVPAAQPCLVYWQWTSSGDACNADYGGIGINGIWESVEPLCAGTATGHWVERIVNLSSYTVTPTVVLNFAVVNDYSIPSTMYIDNISFRRAEWCDSLPVKPSAAAYSAAWLVGKPITTTVSMTTAK